MLRNLFKRDKSVELIFNTDEINCITLILCDEIDRLMPIQHLNKKDTNDYVLAKRYRNLLDGKKVVILPFTSKNREDLLWLIVLLLREADKVKDHSEKEYLNFIAARIQWVHRQLGVNDGN